MDRKMGFESLNDEIYQSQLKTKYKSKIFIGYFKEKRLCEPLKVYRDLIIIEKKIEHEFVKDLENFVLEVNGQVRGQVHVGVTKVEDDFTIWTELDENTAFGKYWFQVGNKNYM